MTKSDFLLSLKDGLSGLPERDIVERLTFYSEMIDDRMDDGISEVAAVAEIGPVEDIVAQILEDYPDKPKRKLRAWELTVIILGFPLWFPLLISAFAVVLSVYAVLWSVLISVWAVEISLWASTFGCCVGAVVVMIAHGNFVSGIVIFGVAFICAGLSIFLYYGCMILTKGIIFLTKVFWSFLMKQLRKGRG